MKKLFKIILMLMFTSSTTFCQWAGMQNGTNGNVYAIAVDSVNNYIYVGGDFTFAGGVFAPFIAKWDGTSWSSLSTGMNAPVRALYFFNGELYAGGNFTQAGSVAANRIAKWTGINWINLGTGVDSTVRAIGEFNSQIFIGGNFLIADGITVNHIAKWDGTAWQSMGTGASPGYIPSVNAIQNYNGYLYVGGWFTSVNGVGAGNIARWNGFTWQGLGIGINDAVEAFTVWNNKLVVGGYFTTLGWVGSPENCATYDGSVWNGLGSGIGVTTAGYVFALTSLAGKLIAGGRFVDAGGITANKIAAWDGNTWQALSTGMNNDVKSLNVLNNCLYAGGDFSTSGGLTTNFISTWCGPVGIGEHTFFENFLLSPNPTSDKNITMTCNIPAQKILTINLYNFYGKLLKTQNTESSYATRRIKISLENLPNGIYFVRMQTPDFVETKRLIISR